MIKRIFDLLRKNNSQVDEFVPSPLMPRVVNISGMAFHFSMPENFSVDMPAEDMIESVDVFNNASLESKGVVNILYRWWDYYVPLDGKKINGTTRFSIDVLKKTSNRKLCLSDLEKLVEYENEDLNRYYKPINKKYTENGDYESEILLPIYPEQYRKVMQNDSTYINYTLSGGKASDIFLFPINCDFYIKVGFDFSPSSNFMGCESLRKIMGSEVNSIVNTFFIEKSENYLLNR